MKRVEVTSLLGLSLFLSSSHCQVGDPKLEGVDLSKAQTIAYCEILDHPDAFKNKLIRVRAMYETDFEVSAITSPACEMSIPMTWIEFEQDWAHRTRWREKRAISKQHWRVQMDVVFVGIFKTGNFGHMDMYPFLLHVYKVEATRPSGSFRPLPE